MMAFVDIPVYSRLGYIEVEDGFITKSQVVEILKFLTLSIY